MTPQIFYQSASQSFLPSFDFPMDVLFRRMSVDAIVQMTEVALFGGNLIFLSESPHLLTYAFQVRERKKERRIVLKGGTNRVWERERRQMSSLPSHQIHFTLTHSHTLKRHTHVHKYTLSHTLSLFLTSKYAGGSGAVLAVGCLFR